MIAQKIAERIGRPDLIDILANELTGSELSSILLDVFDRKTGQLSPADLLRAYQANRFVKPADVDVAGLRALEDRTLTLFSSSGFVPVELSPVAPLGSCSVVATADQKKILSALRQTEVVADATNALALHVADLRKSQKAQPANWLKFCTIHRHLRTPPLPDIPGMRPHFKIACFVHSGRDTGHFQFEKEALTDHIALMTTLFTALVPTARLSVHLYPRQGYTDPVAFVTTLADHVRVTFPDVRLDVKPEEDAASMYYQGLQCRIVLDLHGQSIDIGDGGFVDWTQQLLQNRKERLFTAGIGIELLYRLVASL